MPTLNFVPSLCVRHQVYSATVNNAKSEWTVGERRISCVQPSRQPVPARLPHHVLTVRCFKSIEDHGDEGDNAFGGDPNSDENDGYETVVLSDPATGRTLPCVVEHEVDIMDATYLVCSPQDDVVSFAKSKGDDDMVCVEDEDLIDVLFPAAAAMLADDHVTLLRSAFVLTVDESDAEFLRADGPNTTFDDDDDDEEEEEEDDDAYYDEDDSPEKNALWIANAEDREDSEVVSVIGEFRHGNEDYYVIKPEDPVLLVARRKQGNVVVLDNEELEHVSPLIEAELQALQQEEQDEEQD